MNNFPTVEYGNRLYRSHEGKGIYAEYYQEISKKQCNVYRQKLEEVGFTLSDTHYFGENTFYTYINNKDTVFLSYYPALNEMHVVTEPESNWHDYCDVYSAKKVKQLKTLLCQIDLEDFGASYAIRLDDGRFLIFDGGLEYETDADKLMHFLETYSEGDKPRVAAWIMTHPHCDHYRCFLIFHKKYGDKIVIEKFIYNFPDTSVEDRKEIPALINDNEAEHINRLYEAVEKSGADVYRAHTGQIYHVGNAKMEILSSPDNTMVPPMKNFNRTSLVIKMTIEGQTILWGGDADFKRAKLAERYATYLKSDILQIPHHGFGGGNKDSYALINPKVCLMSSFEKDCFGKHSFRHDHNQFLMYELDVQDYFAGGSGNVILELPYKPRPNGKKLLHEKAQERQKGMGAKYWVFMDVMKGSDEFTVANFSGLDVEVFVDLYFDEPCKNVTFIKFIAYGNRVSKVRITDVTQVDARVRPHSAASLAVRGVPEDERFTVHFQSNWPIVIKGNKPADYYF